jgi:hypothetical protein
MRNDMAKVVTERPRRGHANKSVKTSIQKIRKYDPDDEYEDHPTRLPVSRRRQYGWDAKEFSDLISPLQAYLRKQVGRPWNKVHSELSAKLDKRSLTGRHIWQHIWWEVERECYIGLFKKQKLAFHTQNRKYVDDGFARPVQGLYIHPVTGILQYQSRRQAGAYNKFTRKERNRQHEAAEAKRIASMTPTQLLLEKRRNQPSTLNSMEKAERARQAAHAAFMAAVEKHPEIVKILAA